MLDSWHRDLCAVTFFPTLLVIVIVVVVVLPPSITMPPAKPKPSDVASEAKRVYIPYIAQNMPMYPPASDQIPDSAYFPVGADKRGRHRLRVAVVDGDPVDVALDWQQLNAGSNAAAAAAAAAAAPRIPAVNMANEKRPGGDWESGLLAPEECLCRRSNLIHTLASAKYPAAMQTAERPQYPLPQRGGIYSPYVGMCFLVLLLTTRRSHFFFLLLVVYRDGPDQYQFWQEFKSLPVISVAPVRRPKLDESGKRYSFVQERELMLEKMRTVLRIAAYYGHPDLVLGAFGCGHVFRNPPREVARMWRQLLFQDPEFAGAFSNVVFAVQSSQPGNGRFGPQENEAFNAELADASKIFESLHRGTA